MNKINERNIHEGTNYVIYNEPLGVKYFITATDWNINILRHIANTPNPRPEPFKDWNLGEAYTNKNKVQQLDELPLRYKEFLGIDEMAHGGGYKMKKHGKTRSKRCKRSRRVKGRRMNARRRSIAK